MKQNIIRAINPHIPEKVLEALLAVRKIDESVDRVAYWTDGRWLFSNDNHEVPPFVGITNDTVSVLEAAAEHVIESCDLPVCYQLNLPEDHPAFEDAGYMRRLGPALDLLDDLDHPSAPEIVRVLMVIENRGSLAAPANAGVVGIAEKKDQQA